MCPTHDNFSLVAVVLDIELHHDAERLVADQSWQRARVQDKVFIALVTIRKKECKAGKNAERREMYRWQIIDIRKTSWWYFSRVRCLVMTVMRLCVYFLLEEDFKCLS